MSIFSKLFGSKSAGEERVGGMEDFMTLVRVYYQATMAARLGISNLAALPDLRTFKQTLHVATLNNRPGLGEKKKCKQMLQDVYLLDDKFFEEIDQSIKKRCRNIQEVQPYFLVFQDLSQNLMMSVGQKMQWKLRLPSVFKNTLREMTKKAVHEVLTDNNISDASMRVAAVAVRKARQRLEYSEDWLVQYSFQLLMLAKKEPRQQIDDQK